MSAEEVTYLPLNERMQEPVLASPGPAFTGFNLFPFYRNAFSQFVLRKSLDEIGHRNGWRLHTDGIHLNSCGGKILADLVQEFISPETDEDVPTWKADTIPMRVPKR